MSQFTDRERAFEDKFAHDQGMQFKVMARRNKLLGLWAAAKMGLDDTTAASYAKEVVMADFEETGEEDVYRKVFGDLDNKGLADEREIRGAMTRFLKEAKAQIMAE